MSKEVILMADVAGLGAEGDVVKVSEGFARNYLVPRNLAASVTEATRRRIEKKRKDREELKAKTREEALVQKKAVEAVSCTITVKTGPEGKMYGSVTVIEILEALKKQGVELHKHCLELVEPIKETGVFNLTAKLHPEVHATVKVWVVEE